MKTSSILKLFAASLPQTSGGDRLLSFSDFDFQGKDLYAISVGSYDIDVLFREYNRSTGYDEYKTERWDYFPEEIQDRIADAVADFIF